MKFDGGYDVVYIDEKWFNEDKDDRAYLLFDGEKPPPRDRKSKRFNPKTMFLAAEPAQDRGRTILIQQDNATPHVPPSGPEVVAAGTADGGNIRLLFQPPNSPDLNVLDLGFFASIQSIQYRQQTRGIENLIRAVTDAFEGTSITTLDNIFITLQCVMQCIMTNAGGNRYPLPHMGKAALRK
ncbi:unnamed protein product [Phytophthora fragariaefolia]|uniref:Unnamed protein product n=1 Tax=Phytophthora fragariaefolia TaxID=1490495 RepID=A0A9W6U138_9STRA|nr:unnamed protein product [Phytophthora fragariaefolia]